MTTPHYLARRAFLARIGVLGAAVGAGGLLPSAALAQPPNPLENVVGLLRPVLAELARDTMNGLTVFACPGPDEYSKAQGTPRAEPGAMEAKTTDFMMEALDNFVPFPDELARPVTAALATGLADTGVPLPGIDALASEVGTLDKALGSLLRNDATIPLSLPIASTLNLVATAVNPATTNGPFVSPFARLSYEEKAKAFEIIEAPAAELVSTLDVNLPEPLSDSVSGLLKFVGGALLEFATFGSYSEYAVFDPGTKQLTDRPVGWQLSGYQPNGPVEGWDEFIGYYQDRTEVHD
ncbi:MAG: hypothetical protein GEU98_16615 [Pseudonocardiaceae bacterium]|nr:hypothetical protein [Pseudonocardiaceae bacterium]